MSVMVFLCKSCNGAITYKVYLSKWKCDYCLSEYEEHEITPVENKIEDVNDNEVYSKPKILEFHCSQCGANLICEPNTLADFCLYCKSSNIIKSRISSDFNPKWIIPFALTQKKAEEIYLNWITYHKKIPKTIIKSFGFQQIKAIYIPFWLVDCDVQYRFNGIGINSIKNEDRKVIRYEYHNVSRASECSFRKFPIVGVNKFIKLIKGIEPFDYNSLRAFNFAYMAGVLAEKSDINESKKIAKEWLTEYMAWNLKRVNPSYDKVLVKSEALEMKNESGNYAMLPIYVVSLFKKGKQHIVIINGQTGKLYGEIPEVKYYALLKFILIFTISWLSIISLVFLISLVAYEAI